MPTIYRQYRPQKFADISGQPHVTDILQQAILKKKISHAYLLQGPRGTGKTSTARILAKRLNCTESKDAEPCGSCASCVATAAGKSLDVIEIDAASNRGIDNIRALREQSSLTPTMGAYKVYIIDEVHMLSHDAFPALLKTLEEPLAHVVFILATTELHKVPQTILSRCQVYRFRRATSEEMRARLQYILKQEKRKAEDAVIDFIISRSDGCYRDAESLLGQLLVMEEKTISLPKVSEFLGLPSPTLIQDFLASLITQDLPKAIEIIDSAYAQGFDPDQFIGECIRSARDSAVAISQGKQDAPLLSLANASGRLPVIIRALIQASTDLSYVPQPLIALQLAILTLCQTATPAPSVQANTARPAATPKAANTPISQGVAVSAGLVRQSVKPASPKVVPTSINVAKKEEPSSSSDTAVISVDQVKAIWDKTIMHLKKENPVASTFLRAVEPLETEGKVITLRVSYALHRTFFEKPENKTLLEKTLSELLAIPDIRIRCRMSGEQPIPSFKAQVNASPNGGQAASTQDDNSLYETVKEVFGTV